MKMAVKRAIDRKMKLLEDNDKDRGLKLHKTNCDMLYRWSMWRMYINEEMSRVISARRDHLDLSNSVHAVTSPYIRHPDGKKYGHKMKRSFRNVGASGSHDSLSDNMYLVYGLPRVSLKKRVPEEVQQLHESMHELDLHYQRERESSGSLEAEEEINKLFEFVTADDVQNNNNHLSSNKTKQTEEIKQDNNEIAESTNGKTIASDKSEIYKTKSEKDVPLASRSRLFWEKLSERKSEIIDTQTEKPEVKVNHEHTVISADILQKQQKLLKKTVPKRTSKDLWRTLRERKTEILQMREMTSGSGKTNEHENPGHEKKHESKTSQLWGFIFHKKKDLAHMKRGRRVSHDIAHVHHSNGNKAPNSVPNNYDNSNISPRNFEDSFQKELAERLRKRRVHLEPATSSETLY